MLKIASLFLIAMVVLAMFGKLRLGGFGGFGGPKLGGPPKPQKCGGCGKFLIGSGPCDCGHKA